MRLPAICYIARYYRIPLLWAFHRVHHSAETLTPFTVYRTHPIEALMFALQRICCQAVSIAVFVFFCADAVSLISVLGVNVFLFAFNVLGANLRHSHVPISYPRCVERVLVSPLQHQLHHSLDHKHRDCNFGVVLALWDRMGGTLRISHQERDLRFGLEAMPAASTHTLTDFYWLPIREAFGQLRALVDYGLYLMRKIGLWRVSPSRWTVALMFTLVLATSTGVVTATQAEELNVYSHRQPVLIKPFLQAFESETGIKVNVVYSAKGLAQRLQAEGERSPADIVLTVDIGRLHLYADKDLLAPISSEILNANIPAHLRDPHNRWFAFSKRARVIAIAKDRVGIGEINRLEDLADPKWKGRICSRPGSHVYNRALLASLIAANGEAAAERWANALVENLAQRPQGADRAQVKAIYQGVCDIALINSYYYGKLKSSEVPEHREWAGAIDIVFTNQQDRGNHINISGGGIAKHSKHKENAVKFMEFLSQAHAQRLYSSINYEYPVNPRVEPSAELTSWGEFREDDVAISRIAVLGPAAQRIIDRVGW